MGWEDREYYRDGGHGRNPLAFLLFGSVPLFTIFRIRVRAHISLILFIALVLLFGGMGNFGFTFQDRLEAMTILFNIVLLHEFGHCFASRWVGGDADEVMMTPLGGLALIKAPHRPLATFIAVAGGPAVNVLICLLAAAGMYLTIRVVPWNPLAVHHFPHGLLVFSGYLFWIYSISLALLLFNLLPIFPLDGGQMLQSILWPKLGYRRSMHVACIVGIVGGIVLVLVALLGRRPFLLFIALSGIATCISMRAQLREMGIESEFGGDEMDFSASLQPDEPTKKRRRPNRWKIRRLRRQAARDASEQQMLDAVLAKVSAHGMGSLTWSERRALKRATARQREREVGSRQ